MYSSSIICNDEGILNGKIVEKEVSPELAAIHDLVLNAQREGVSAVRPGVSGASIDEICRSIITQAGYGADFIHGHLRNHLPR